MYLHTYVRTYVLRVCNGFPPPCAEDEVKHPVKVKLFEKHVAQRHRNSDHLFSEEYEVGRPSLRMYLQPTTLACTYVRMYVCMNVYTFICSPFTLHFSLTFPVPPTQCSSTDLYLPSPSPPSSAPVHPLTVTAPQCGCRAIQRCKEQIRQHTLW